MKKIYTLLFAIMASISFTNAEIISHVQIDDLYYDLDDTNQQAKVTSQNSEYPYWTTDITTADIPSSVIYNAVTYTVIGIGESAFMNCIGLTAVTIPNSVTSIGTAAFSGCWNLTSVSIPNSVRSISAGAFFFCEKLTSVTIPNGITGIEHRTFYDCSSLDSIAIPASVDSIGIYAFSGCTGLTAVTCLAKDVPILKTQVFGRMDCSKIPLYVPAESVEAYRAADEWKDFNPIVGIEVPEEHEAVENTSVLNSASTTKTLRNGQILIRRSDRTYTLTGQEVR